MSKYACLVLVAAFAVCGCSDATSPTALPAPPASIHFVGTTGGSDTAKAMLPQLVVEVRDAGGRLVSAKTPVAIEGLLMTGSNGQTGIGALLCYSNTPDQCISYGYTDSTSGGRITAYARLGSLTGTARITAFVPGTALADTVSFTVLPGTAAPVARGPLRHTASSSLVSSHER